MTDMLQALKHIGPDSTGYALYGSPISNYIMRINLAEQADTKKVFDVASQLQSRNDLVDARMAELGASVAKKENSTAYALRYEVSFDGNLKNLIDYETFAQRYKGTLRDHV